MSYINLDLIKKYDHLKLIIYQKKLLLQEFTDKKIPNNKEIICGICLKEILETEINLSCPDCNKFIHKNCMMEWLEKNKSCIYCRSEIWETFFSLKIKKTTIYLKIIYKSYIY